MPLAIALGIVGALLVVLFVAMARERGPDPVDTALAYEAATDRLDFSLLYDLSGEELRDRLTREKFVAAKRAAHAAVPTRERLAVRIDVDGVVAGGESAAVVTRVTSIDGAVCNEVLLERRHGRWVVVAYSLRPPSGSAEAPGS